VKTLDFPSDVAAPECLLAFDFDGTLVLPGEVPPVLPEFFDLLRHMRESHKILWGINTGRSLMQTVQGMSEAKFPFLPDYLIAREREIYTPNKFGRWMPVVEWNKQCEKAHRKLFRKCRRLLKHLRQWVESETSAVWVQQEGEPAGIVASTAAEMDAIIRKINEALPAKPILSYQRNGVYLRFSHRDYHKGTAMLEVARRYDLTSERTFAIGDSHNDLDMLDPSMAALTACPGNACDEVKARVSAQGGYVANGEASAGVIEALQVTFFHAPQRVS